MWIERFQRKNEEFPFPTWFFKHHFEIEIARAVPTRGGPSCTHVVHTYDLGWDELVRAPTLSHAESQLLLVVVLLASEVYVVCRRARNSNKKNKVFRHKERARTHTPERP